MKRFATGAIVGLIALLALGVPRARADSLLFSYIGFDYEDADLDPSVFGQVGDGYVGLGELSQLSAPLVADMTNNRYTYYISGLTAVSRMVQSNVAIIDYSPGTLAIYEDPKSGGTTPVYGSNPPNGTAPSTFTDGTQILLGSLTNFRVVLSLITNTGSFEASFTVIGGSQAGSFSQLQGWTFAGATGNAHNILSGYDHQIAGQVFLNEPVPVRIASWGTIKARYR